MDSCFLHSILYQLASLDVQGQSSKSSPKMISNL
uniref:Uncharacterized protein n=1 Tax=Cucumis melo TaxID=3656 RepID=A0A9I9EFX4_CUCME